MSSGWFDFTEPSLSTSLQGKQDVQGAYALARGGSSTLCYLCDIVIRLGSMRFNGLEQPRNSAQTPCTPCFSYSNHNITEIRSKVWRGLSHKFGVLQLYRIFSIYIIAGETRCTECLCISSGWFKVIEPHRTYSNHNTTEIARCGEVCHMSSGWFDCTEPSLSTSLQGKQGVQGAYALVRGGSSTSNLIEPILTTAP